MPERGDEPTGDAPTSDEPTEVEVILDQPTEDGLLVDEPIHLEVTGSEQVFDGAVWHVRRDRFRYNGGEITREYLDHPGAVAVLAFDDQDRVLLIQQYRHPVRRREWELPAGLLDVAGEPPLDAAKRELAEEADLAAEHWEQLAFFHTSPGGSDESITIFSASGVSATDEFERSDEEADIVVRWVPFGDALEAVLDGRVTNAILQIAVLTAHAKRS